MSKPDCSQCEWCNENCTVVPIAHPTFTHSVQHQYKCDHPRSQLGDYSSMESLVERAATGCPKQNTEWRC